MPEISTHPVEAREEEKKISMAKKVFDNVYEQLRQNSSGSTSAEKAKGFIDRIKDGAERHVTEIEDSKLTSTQLLDDIWQKMGEYIVAHRGGSDAETVESEVSSWFVRLRGHTDWLVKHAEVDALTAKVFLKSLPNLRYIGDYNALIRDASVPIEILAQKNAEYAPFAEDMFSKHTGPGNTDEGGFYHFNPKTPGKVKTRVYVCADVQKSPRDVVAKWVKTLEEKGLKDKIYFKIPNGMTPRFETLIIYVKDTTSDQELEEALKCFTDNTPTDLFNAKDMPTGIPLRRGISMAPEPANINKLLKYSDSPIISYNLLISA